jgi:hypothetical protein
LAPTSERQCALVHQVFIAATLLTHAGYCVHHDLIHVNVYVTSTIVDTVAASDAAADETACAVGAAAAVSGQQHGRGSSAGRDSAAHIAQDVHNAAAVVRVRVCVTAGATAAVVQFMQLQDDDVCAQFTQLQDDDVCAL